MDADDAAVFLDLAAHLLELFDLAADDGDVGAEGGQLVRRAAADAAAAAGDDDGLAGEQAGPEFGLIWHRVLV
jgi:hypothetical protein